jgi:hypothetical protein
LRATRGSSPSPSTIPIARDVAFACPNASIGEYMSTLILIRGQGGSPRARSGQPCTSRVRESEKNKIVRTINLTTGPSTVRQEVHSGEDRSLHPVRRVASPAVRLGRLDQVPHLAGGDCRICSAGRGGRRKGTAEGVEDGQRQRAGSSAPRSGSPARRMSKVPARLSRRSGLAHRAPELPAQGGPG